MPTCRCFLPFLRSPTTHHPLFPFLTEMTTVPMIISTAPPLEPLVNPHFRRGPTVHLVLVLFELSERLLTAQSVVERRPKAKKEQRVYESEETPLLLQQQQCSKVVTQLVEPPSPSQLLRWNLRSMWELASVLNFLNVFRPLLNINVEFSVEEFESVLISPNDTLSDVHIPLLKAIPPITRMALTRKTWVTVLCRKLRDWWYWVADGDLLLVASHGSEVEVYRTLDPSVRVVILKALCDILFEQEDIRNYIENSLKHGVQLSAFRKERIGGDSHGMFYWYEEDSIVGHRLYREIRKVELKKKGQRFTNPS